MTMVTVLGVSTPAGSAGAGAGLTRAWAPGHALNTVAVAVCETAQETVVAPAGFAECTGSPGSPQGTGTAGDPLATRLTACYCRASGPGMPDIQIANPGDHIAWQVIFLDNCITTGNPIVAINGDVASSPSGVITIPGLTTPNADCMVLSIIAHGIDGSATQVTWPTPLSNANTSLANLTERMNYGTGSNNGGGFAMLSGEKATAGVVSNTVGTLATAFRQGRLMLAVRGLASGGGTVAASDRLCGGECNAPVGLPGPGTRHFDGEQGTPFVSQTAIARHGGRAWRSSPIGAQSFRSWAVSGTTRWFREYIRFPTLPAVDTVIVRFRVASGGFSPELRYRAATQDIVAAVGSSLGTPHPVSAGNWYRVSMAADVGTGTRTCKLTVALDDGTPVDRGTASLAVAAGSLTFLDFGASVQDAITADLVMDDLRSGADVTLYPVGAGRIIGLQLTGDGTHSFSPAGDFKYDNSSNIATGATDTYLRLLGLPDNFTQFLAASAVAVGEYLEWLWTGSMPATSAIAAVELISTHEGSDTNAHKQTLRMIDGGTTLDIFTDADFSETGLVVHAKHLRLAPSGAAWTTALWNAIKSRWGSSWTAVDIAGVPYIGGVMAEADVTLSTPPPPPPDPSAQNPLHVYPAPATYQVTLTVTDDQGLTDSVTHPATTT